MAGDEDVGEGEEAGEDVVLEDLTAEVFKEEVGFFFIDIEAEVAEVAGLEGLDDGAGIDEAAAGGIDEHGTGLHALESGGVDEVMSGGHQGAMQADDVALSQDFVERQIEHTAVAEGGIGIEVGGKDTAAEAEHDAGKDATDAAGADDAHGFALEVEAQEAIEGEIAFADAVEGAVGFAVEGKDEGDGVLGDGVGGVGGDADDGDVVLAGGIEIDVVEAGAAGGNQARAAGGEGGDDALVEYVVDEDADAFEAMSETGGVFAKVWGEVVDVVAGAGVEAVEDLAFKAMGAEEGDFHRTSANPFLSCLKTRPPRRKARPEEAARKASSLQSGRRWVRMRSR